MTRIVDTTIRLLSQQPLVATITTAGVLEVAEILDQAGFAALEVSGGGCFDAAVQRGNESPWERIRGIKARCSHTPLQIALRGRFLVGSCSRKISMPLSAAQRMKRRTRSSDTGRDPTRKRPRSAICSGV